jgi:hypothetical protein
MQLWTSLLQLAWPIGITPRNRPTIAAYLERHISHSSDYIERGRQREQHHIQIKHGLVGGLVVMRLEQLPMDVIACPERLRDPF